MRFRNHRLVDHWYQASRDVDGPLRDPRFIVMHYTAGGSGSSSRDYMLLSPTQKKKRLNSNKKVYASAHVIIDRDGTIWQIVPFNRVARHAGLSSWRGLNNLNRHAIGIELANWGWLRRQADGSYGRSEDHTPDLPPARISLGAMPGTNTVMGWENYTAAQIKAAESIVRGLLGKYPSLIEVVGHQDISPRRKFDPGPAFPLQRFRNLISGRGFGARDSNDQDNEQHSRFATTARLNIRGGPGIQYEKLDISPLAIDTGLIKLDEEGEWYFVQLDSNESVHGWVHRRYTRLILD